MDSGLSPNLRNIYLFSSFIRTRTTINYEINTHYENYCNEVEWKLRKTTGLYSKQRNAGKSRLNESTLFNRIHKHSIGGFGADTLTFWGGGAVGFSKGWIEVSDSLCIAASVCYEKFLHSFCKRVGSNLLFFIYSNYFQKESTLFEKPVPFSMNTALYPRKELTLWVDSQKGRLGRYYGDFSSNYFEYWLMDADIFANQSVC